MTTTTEPVTIKSNGLANLAFSRGTLESLVKDFPPDKATFQPVPTANHLLWVIGHLAWTDDYFMVKLLGQKSKIPESWTDLFGMGSEPIDDPARYPSLAEVRKVAKERRDALLEWFRGRTEAQLAEPLPEDWQEFAPNHGALMGALAAHECMHAGQFTVIRKALKLPRTFG